MSGEPPLTSQNLSRQTDEMSNQRVVWTTNSLGYGDDLLYWGPILSRYVQSFPNARFFTAADGQKVIPQSDVATDVATDATEPTRHVVERLPSVRLPLGRRRYSYDRHVRLVSPSSIQTILAEQPDALVISEFTIPSLFATRIRKRRATPILLLVESDPLRGDPLRVGLLKRVIRRYIAKRVDWVLTNNDAGRRYIESHLPVRNDRILSGPYVVSDVAVDRMRPPTRSQADPRDELGDRDKLVFLYVGQLIARKGLAQLIAAVGRLSPEDRSLCSFWILGEGDQRSTLERQVSQLGLDRQVRILGRRTYEAIGAYYRSADIFVMPTLDDYRALVGFEAIAYGLPLLHSCHDGAIGEVVDEGRNGFVVDPFDPHSLTEGLARFIALRNNLNSFRDHSQEISRRFTLSIAVHNLVDATHRCLKAV